MRPTFFLTICAAALLAHGLAPAAPAQDAGEAVRRPAPANVLPFVGVAQEARELHERGDLDLGLDAEVRFTATLRGDGTLDLDSVEARATGDERLVGLGRHLLAAVSQSRLLATLEGVKVVHLSFKLGGGALRLGLAAEAESEERASRLALGYGGLLQVARLSKKGTQEGALYEALRVSADGRRFNVTLEMPREDAGRWVVGMLERGKAAAGLK